VIEREFASLTWVMTTKFYVVIYPHPEVPRGRHILRLGLDPEAGGDTVLERLCNTYPNLRDDLEDATLWKASYSTVVQLPP